MYDDNNEYFPVQLNHKLNDMLSERYAFRVNNKNDNVFPVGVNPI